MSSKMEVEWSGDQMQDFGNGGSTKISSYQSILDEILKKLSVEDITLRTYRRAIGVSQTMRKELMPLLINGKDERKITDTAIKILANLTTPVECLLSIDVMSKTEAGRNTIIELNWLLFSCKEMFLDPKSTRRVLDHIRNILEKGENLTRADCNTLNDSVILLRNILHIPDLRPCTSGVSHKNQILWNLFAQNIDKILIDLMNGSHRAEWRAPMVQLISLLYQDQHVTMLQKLLNAWFETAVVSESSEDDESNTSPPQSSGDSSSLVTSDPTSDSSDNSCTDPKKTFQSQPKKSQTPSRKIKKEQNQKTQDKQIARNPSEKKIVRQSSESSDCGYCTQIENHESIGSTSSNEDDPLSSVSKRVHHKPCNMIQKSRQIKPTLTPQEKDELKRKNFTRRSRTNKMNMKALLHYTPTEEDITQLLKEFTVDFLLKGYNSLVCDLREQLIFGNRMNCIDTSHFFWLLTYFLKFAVQLELGMEHISSVLTFKIVSFVTFEGIGLCEQFEMEKNNSECDMRPCLRKIHLVVTTIRELIQAINSYKKFKHLSDEDRRKITKLQRQMCETEELRCLFVLLLRQYNPTLQNTQYLQDVIVTNHLLLSFIESSTASNANKILQSHIKQFVAVDMMKQYGHLLECFQQNGKYVNDCVFTMMHHVAGDLESVTSLFQPKILKTFSQIWDTKYELCDDWSDLIEYAMHKFINLPRIINTPEKNAMENCLPINAKKWSQEDCDSLYWYYVQSANSDDPIGAVISLYADSGSNKTRIGVIEQLLKQDVITGLQFNELMEKQPITVTEEPAIQDSAVIRDEIELLKEHLIKENKTDFLTWVQKVLLEVCNAKLSYMNKTKTIVEPLPYYCTMLQEPIPVVAWNFEQCAIMQNQVFLLLLHKLGLLLPADAGKVFARIPHSWNPDTLYNIACKLGPLHSDWVKFNIEEVVEININTKRKNSFSSSTEYSPPYISSIPR